jgi:hypothetical protein
LNPNPTYYRREKLAGEQTAFLFDGLDPYNRFIDEVDQAAQGNARRGFDMINAPNYVSSNASQRWYGTDDTSWQSQPISTFLFNNELDSFLQSFRNSTVNVDISDIDQQKSIKFTEKEIGVFSFDLASLGLIKVYEYYSPLLKRIVKPEFVKSFKNDRGELIFYHIYTPAVPKHICKYNISTSGYYSNILKRNVNKSDLVEEITDNEIYFVFPERAEIPRHDVERKQKIGENGKPKFATTFKKCFIEIPKIEKPLPRIDIIVPATYSAGVNAQNQMLYGSMAAITLAEKLSKSGVNYRIIACYGVQTTGSGRSKEVYPFVTLKKEGEPLDKNKIAVLLSDGRQFRYRQFKGFFAVQFDAGYDSNISVLSIGRPITGTQEIKRAYLDLLSKSPNPEDRAAAERPNSKIVLPLALSERDAQNAYNSIINQIVNL